MKYDELPGMNWSRLKTMMRSPKQAKWELEHGGKDTPAMLRGRMVHCALYEPALFPVRYRHMPNFHGGMKNDTAIEKGYDGGREAKAAWLEMVAADKSEIVTADEKGLALDMADAVLDDPVAGPLVSGSYVEQVITWNCGDIPCKGRVDQVNGRLGDLKTTVSVEPRAFANQVEKLGYLGQMAWYSDGLYENGIQVQDTPVWIAVEATPPHDVVVYEIGLEDLQAGRDLYRRLLDRWIQCEIAGEWPGIAEGRIVPFRRAAWARAAEAEAGEALTIGGVPMEWE